MAAIASGGVSVTLKWGKKMYENVVIDPNATAADLKAQVFALTGVPAERQKLLSKKGGWKGPLSDTQNMKKIKLKPGKTQLVLMGSAVETTAPSAGAEEKIVFMEDMSKTEQAQVAQAVPCGLNNLGNTCYMNSTLQCLRHIPELRTALQLHTKALQQPNAQAGADQSSHVFAQQLARMYDGMDRVWSPEAVTPMQFVAVLRQLFPRFAERGQRGGFAQQDAEELYNTVMGQLGMVLSPSTLGADGEAQKIFAGSSTSVIDALFGIEIEQTDTCLEAEAEAPSMRKVNEFKLRCNIQGGGGTKDEEKVDHLFQGLEAGLVGQIEKQAPTLGRNAVWKRVQRIDRLPRILCVQYMRFYWKKRQPTQMDPSTGTNCKMKRRVQYQEKIDMFRYCSSRLQAILKVSRDKAADARLAGTKPDDSAAAAAKPAAAAAATEADDVDMAGAADTDADAALQAALALSKQSDDGAAGASAAGLAGYGLPADFQGHYELFAIVSHIGRSANSGHYIGWARRETGKDDWLRFDDANVDECKTVDVLDLDGGTGDRDMAYLAFYRAVE